jgi:putative transposase
MVERQGPLSLRRQCVLLGLSRAALYYRPVKISAYQLELMALIDRQYLRAPFYGARRLAAWLGTQGHTVNRKRVKRLMQLMGLAAIYQRPRTSRPAPEHRIYPYLLRGLVIERINQVWAADICYIPMARGFLYLVAVMDWVSRYVLAWRLSNLLDTSFCIAALEEALSKGRPEIFNTDQGSQFTGEDFTSVLRAHEAAISMDGRAGASATTSLSSGHGVASSMRRSISEPTRALPKPVSASHHTSSFIITNACTRHSVTAHRARPSTKQRHLPVRRGGKTLARTQHDQHHEMQTWAGFLTLRSPDRCLEDRVHLENREQKTK